MHTGKATTDETRLKNSIDIGYSCLNDTDTAYYLTGRNKFIGIDMKKNLLEFKPKLVIKECAMEYNDEELIAHLRLSRRKMSSVDTTDGFLEVSKQAAKLIPSEQRRFICGHTAFSKLKDCPLPTKEAAVKVMPEVLKAIFKSVGASDKYTRGSNEENDAQPEDDVVPDADGKVAPFPMELHPLVAGSFTERLMHALHMHRRAGSQLWLAARPNATWEFLTPSIRTTT